MFCLIFLLGHIVLVTELMARPSIFVHCYMWSKLLHIISEEPVRYDSQGVCNHCVTSSSSIRWWWWRWQWQWWRRWQWWWLPQR